MYSYVNKIKKNQILTASPFFCGTTSNKGTVLNQKIKSTTTFVLWFSNRFFHNEVQACLATTLLPGSGKAQLTQGCYYTSFAASAGSHTKLSLSKFSSNLKTGLTKVKKQIKENSINREKQVSKLSNFRQKWDRSEVATKKGFSIGKIINLIMRDGEKAKASQIFYKALTIITKKKILSASAGGVTKVAALPHFSHNRQPLWNTAGLFSPTLAATSVDKNYIESKSNLEQSSTKKTVKQKPLKDRLLLSSGQKVLVKQHKEVSQINLLKTNSINSKTTVSKKIYSPRIFPPAEHLLFKGMLLSAQSRLKLRLFDKENRNLFLYLRNKPLYKSDWNSSSVCQGTSPANKLSSPIVFVSPVVAPSLVEQKGCFRRQANHSQYVITTHTTVKSKRNVSAKTQVIKFNSITLFYVFAVLSLTGQHNLNKKVATFFSVLIAKASSNLLSNVVKIRSTEVKRLLQFSNYSLVNDILASTVPSEVATLNKQHNFLKKSLSKQQQAALEIVKAAIENVKPSLEVRKVRIAGTTYQVPAILDKKKSISQAIRWIIESARIRKIRSKNNFSICLAEEFLDAFQKQGKARQKRDQLHNLASANRAYVRYRWW